MRLLLDTNALIWWLSEDGKLGRAATALIAHAESEILVSIVSLWEVTVKWRTGKIALTGSELLDGLVAETIEPMPIRTSHLRALESLAFHHRDPFDHLILAQAKVERAAIVTSDHEMARYGIPCIRATQ